MKEGQITQEYINIRFIVYATLYWVCITLEKIEGTQAINMQDQNQNI